MAGAVDGNAVAHGNEEAPKGGEGAGEAGHRRAFLAGLAQGLLLADFPADRPGFVEAQEDGGNLHEGGTVAEAGHHEQHHEAEEEAPEGTALAVGVGQEQQHAENADDGAGEHVLGDAGAALDFVRPPAAHRPGQRRDERAEEGEFQRIDPGELALNQHGEAGGKAEEGTEGAQVDETHNPVVLAAEDDRLLAEAGAGAA